MKQVSETMNCTAVFCLSPGEGGGGGGTMKVGIFFMGVGEAQYEMELLEKLI